MSPARWCSFLGAPEGSRASTHDPSVPGRPSGWTASSNRDSARLRQPIAGANKTDVIDAAMLVM
jgi:hypothetical protein